MHKKKEGSFIEEGEREKKKKKRNKSNKQACLFWAPALSHMAGLREVLDNYKHHRELVFRHHLSMTSGKARTQEINKHKKQQRWFPANSSVVLGSNQPDFSSAPSAMHWRTHASSDRETEGLPTSSDQRSIPKAIPKQNKTKKTLSQRCYDKTYTLKWNFLLLPSVMGQRESASATEEWKIKSISALWWKGLQSAA